MPAVDANGTSRPQGSAWDIGACEWFSGAQVCPNLQGTIIQPPLTGPIAQVPPPPPPTPTNSPVTLSPTTGTLQIGGSQFGEYFKGLIDEVRICNRALNDAEIRAIYQQGSE
jgi:Concanavalin A-like lectin/glucanases superfamily